MAETILADTRHAERRLMLDGMRGVAAIAVMIYHLTSHTDFWIMRGAYFAVDLFFCLSGFVLAVSYRTLLTNGLSVSEFMARRLIRLYPLYIAGTILGFAALCIKTTAGQTDYSSADLADALRCNLLFLPYFNARLIVLFPTNAAAWSLFFELFVNLVFARAAGLRSKYVWMLVVASFAVYFVTLIATAAQPGWSSGNFWGGFPRTLYGFFAGVGVEAFLRRKKENGARPWPASVGFALLALVAALFLSPIGLTYLCSLILAPCIVYGAARVEAGPRFASACALLGWLSYPLYCLHCPIYDLVESGALLAGAPLPPAMLVVTAGLVTLVAAIALTRWYEEPARRALSTRLSARLRDKWRVEPEIAARPRRAAQTARTSRPEIFGEALPAFRPFPGGLSDQSEG